MVDQSGFFHVSMLIKYVSSEFQQLPAANLTLWKLQNPHENNRYIIPQQTVKLRVLSSGKATNDFFPSSVAGQLFEKFGIISNVNGYITIVDNLPLPTQTGEITPGFLIFRISQGFFKAPRRPRSAAGFLMEAPAERLEVRYQSCAKMSWMGL